MNKTSLSALYRRLTAVTAAPTPDAADLASAAEGSLSAERRDKVAEALAGSSVHAKVVHVLRDLKTESETLAADVSRTQRETTHRRQQRGERRIAANRRFGGALRWATAMAACLVAVVGVWTLRHEPKSDLAGTRSHAAVARPDTIFAMGMETPKTHKVRVEGDRLFHADFGGNGS